MLQSDIALLVPISCDIQTDTQTDTRDTIAFIYRIIITSSLWLASLVLFLRNIFYFFLPVYDTRYCTVLVRYLVLIILFFIFLKIINSDSLKKNAKKQILKSVDSCGTTNNFIDVCKSVHNMNSLKKCWNTIYVTYVRNICMKKFYFTPFFSFCL